MNPYEADPDKIPTTDLYSDVPFYGRYHSKPNDFCVDLQHVNSQTTEFLTYWASVISLCTEEIRIYPADEGGRYANEICAIALAETALKDVKVPEIYFAGKINDRQVLVQERLLGVTLAVVWPYLSKGQMKSFKEQARKILHQLHTINPTEKLQVRSHVVPDPNMLNNGRINPLEGRILFSDINHDPDMRFMHNEFTQSNCIVDKVTIVGLVDREMAGYFGWKTAGQVHRRIRTPQREHFVNANLSEEQLREIMLWNDLYDEGVLEE